MGKEFNEALGNFINNFANGGAIRHLVECGYTVDEILEKLDYPTSKENVAQIAYKYYLETGVICNEKPVDNIEKATYIKEYGSYGKVSLRKVTNSISIDSTEYIACEYGKLLYQKKEITGEIIMSERMKEHILSLPWPLSTVWVRKDFFDK